MDPPVFLVDGYHGLGLLLYCLYFPTKLMNLYSME
jgi:hypothetical protein